MAAAAEPPARQPPPSPAGLSPATKPASAAASRKPHLPPKAGEVRELTIKDLGNFDYDPQAGGAVPEDVTRLDGLTVRLPGFMMPLDQAEHITRFVLVPSLFGCCFGQPPGVQHTVFVECPAGKSVEYCPDQVVVEGKLKVKVVKEDDYVVSLFQMTVHQVQFPR